MKIKCSGCEAIHDTEKDFAWSWATGSGGELRLACRCGITLSVSIIARTGCEIAPVEVAPPAPIEQWGTAPGGDPMDCADEAFFRLLELATMCRRVHNLGDADELVARVSLGAADNVTDFRAAVALGWSSKPKLVDQEVALVRARARARTQKGEIAKDEAGDAPTPSTRPTCGKCGRPWQEHKIEEGSLAVLCRSTPEPEYIPWPEADRAWQDEGFMRLLELAEVARAERRDDAAKALAEHAAKGAGDSRGGFMVALALAGFDELQTSLEVALVGALVNQGVEGTRRTTDVFMPKIDATTPDLVKNLAGQPSSKAAVVLAEALAKTTSAVTELRDALKFAGGIQPKEYGVPRWTPLEPDVAAILVAAAVVRRHARLVKDISADTARARLLAGITAVVRVATASVAAVARPIDDTRAAIQEAVSVGRALTGVGRLLADRRFVIRDRAALDQTLVELRQHLVAVRAAADAGAGAREPAPVSIWRATQFAVAAMIALNEARAIGDAKQASVVMPEAQALADAAEALLLDALAADAETFGGGVR